MNGFRAASRTGVFAATDPGGRLCDPLASAALLHGVRIVAERQAAGGQHAETLLGLVDGVLEASGVRIDDVEAFAVSKGPGAFTSLRVGLATIKGLAFGSERPVVGISTLEALAWEVTEQMQTELPVAVLLDARREQCYAGAYERRGDGLNTVFAAGVYPAAELSTQLPELCHVAGSGRISMRKCSVPARMGPPGGR